MFRALYTDDSKWKCQTQAKSSWATQVPGLSLGALTRLWSTWSFDGKLDHCMGRAYENWRTWIFSIGQGTSEDQTKGLVQTEGLESSPKWPRGLARVNAFQVIRSTWVFSDAWSVIRWSVSWPMAFGDLVTPNDLSMGTRLLGDQDAKCHSHKEKSVFCNVDPFCG